MVSPHVLHGGTGPWVGVPGAGVDRLIYWARPQTNAEGILMPINQKLTYAAAWRWSSSGYRWARHRAREARVSGTQT